MQEIKAPHTIISSKGKTVFLAGSIAQDKASLWQDTVVERLKEIDGTILNPRRSEWDSAWKQEIGNNVFREQVDWELDALTRADIILMFFDVHTQSPITLLELGLFAASKKLIVCCPEGFWRKGNVDIVCDRYQIEQVSSLEELINSVKEKLK